jgi:uncharacterized protein
MSVHLVTSRYNFSLALSDGYALFNANTGSILHFKGPDARELAELLTGPITSIPADGLDDSLTARLRRNGFLINKDFDEVEVIRERYETARGNAPIVLLLTTTLDCNLGCYYCYEPRTRAALQVRNIEQIVNIAHERLQQSGKRSLHVDWYGGEPLLNLEFLEKASMALQAFCSTESIRYHASVVSNGTSWPEEVGAFVERHRIRQVQISIDGMKMNHDKRRRFRKGYSPKHQASSFDRAVRLIDRLLQYTRVDIRFNADPGNQHDLPAFIDFAKARGWFEAPFRCKLLVAKLSAYSERSEFMRRRMLAPAEFDALLTIAREKLPADAREDEELVNGFPFPKTSVCSALARDSSVIGADGLEYRCGLQVGEPHRAVGRLGGSGQGEIFLDRQWWEAFDPTKQPTCSQCSFLPLCWGGCPKRHLERSQADMDAEGRFWRTNLPRLIANGFGEKPPEGFAYTEADQFRGTALIR